MKTTRTAQFILATLIAFTLPLAAAERYFGEPVQLKGRAIYFTSWKYVRQGSFTWRVQVDPNASEAERNIGAWLKGDGNRPAVFETIDMPRGIRLVAQPAEKVPFKDGQLAAQVFDEGKYKAWYVVGPVRRSRAFQQQGQDPARPQRPRRLRGIGGRRELDAAEPRPFRIRRQPQQQHRLARRPRTARRAASTAAACSWTRPRPTSATRWSTSGCITDEEWAAFEKKYPGEADTMARRPDVGGFRCVFGFFGAVSPDGLHWKSLPEPLMIQHADTHEHLLLRRGPQTVRRLRARVAGERAHRGQPAGQLDLLDHRGPALDRPRGEQGLPPFQPAGDRGQPPAPTCRPAISSTPTARRRARLRRTIT